MTRVKLLWHNFNYFFAENCLSWSKKKLNIVIGIFLTILSSRRLKLSNQIKNLQISTFFLPLLFNSFIQVPTYFLNYFFLKNCFNLTLKQSNCDLFSKYSVRRNVINKLNKKPTNINSLSLIIVQCLVPTYFSDTQLQKIIYNWY